MAAVRRGKHQVAGHEASQQALHQRPVDEHGHAVAVAPRQDLGADLALQHVEMHLAGGERTGGGKPFQLRQRDVGNADGAGFPLREHF